MIDIRVLASGSTGNCYFVTDGSTSLLLECGISFKEIRRGLNFRTSEIAACLVSHEHKDHSKAVADLCKAGIDVFMSPGTYRALGLGDINHRIFEIQARQQFNIGTWTVLPIETEHDAEEPLGFLLANQTGDKLLFATDTYYIRYRFKGLTHLMLECNYAADILQRNVDSGLVPAAMEKRIWRSHFSLEHVKEFLRANDLSKVRQIWLLHLSNDNSDEERFRREIQGLTGKEVYIA